MDDSCRKIRPETDREANFLALAGDSIEEEALRLIMRSVTKEAL
jgi:hypothetical protein